MINSLIGLANAIDQKQFLPPSWKLVKLKDVCTINPKRPFIKREDTMLTTFVPMSAVDEYTGTISFPETRPFIEVKSGYTYFKENDILFAKITPCMENGKTAIARNLIDNIGFGSTEFHVLRPECRVIPEWIHLFLRRESFRKECEKHFRGAVGQQRVPASFL